MRLMRNRTLGQGLSKACNEEPDSAGLDSPVDNQTVVYVCQKYH